MTVLVKILVLFLDLISTLIQLYTYIIFGAVILSWVNADPYNPIVRFIRTVTEPVLAPVRRRMWRFTVRTQLDLSPMVVIFGLIVVQILIGELQGLLIQGARPVGGF